MVPTSQLQWKELHSHDRYIIYKKGTWNAPQLITGPSRLWCCKCPNLSPLLIIWIKQGQISWSTASSEPLMSGTRFFSKEKLLTNKNDLSTPGVKNILPMDGSNRQLQFISLLFPCHAFGLKWKLIVSFKEKTTTKSDVVFLSNCFYSHCLSASIHNIH